MKDLNEVSLLDIMPGSIAVDAEARSIDPQLRAVSAAVDVPSIYAGFDGLSSDVLDHLAAQYDVTVWRDDWPDSVKRSVLRTAITDKRKKGTVGAVKNAVSSLGSAVTITEHGGHRFTIYVAQGDIEGHVAAEVQSDIIAAVEDAKPVRSHYDFVIQQPVKGALNACAFLRCLSFARVSSTGKVQAEITGGVQLGAHVRPIVMRRLVGRIETEIVMPELPSELYVYFTAQGESATTNRTIGYTAWYELYDADGKTIPFKPECEYTLIKFIAADGYEYNPNESTYFYPQFHFGYTSNSEYILYLYLKVNVSRGFRQVVYRETPATLYTGYLNADKTPGVAGPWSIAIIYDENGEEVPYGSSSPLIAVAYYYVNGERIYNGDAKVRVTDTGGRLAIGAQSDITIEKIEYSIQPGVY